MLIRRRKKEGASLYILKTMMQQSIIDRKRDSVFARLRLCLQTLLWHNFLRLLKEVYSRVTSFSSCSCQGNCFALCITNIAVIKTGMEWAQNRKSIPLFFQWFPVQQLLRGMETESFYCYVLYIKMHLQLHVYMM